VRRDFSSLTPDAPLPIVPWIVLSFDEGLKEVVNGRVGRYERKAGAILCVRVAEELLVAVERARWQGRTALLLRRRHWVENENMSFAGE
jgi:hypothetical protein